MTWRERVTISRADFFVRSEDCFERQHPDSARIYRSSVLTGFTLNINYLWQQPLPKVRDVTGPRA